MFARPARRRPLGVGSHRLPLCTRGLTRSRVVGCLADAVVGRCNDGLQLALQGVPLLVGRRDLRPLCAARPFENWTFLAECRAAGKNGRGERSGATQEK